MNTNRHFKNAEHDLLKTPTFLYAVGIPIALSIITTASILMSETLFFCFRHECFNNLLQYFKVPLGIASISIPLGALAAAQHRSQQTLHQISVQRAQNNLTGYFTHREQFKEYCKTTFPNTTKYDPDFLHDLLFRDSKTGDYGLSDIKELRNIKAEIEFMRYKLESTDTENQESLVQAESASIYKNVMLLGIEYFPKDLTRQLNTVLQLSKVALFMESSTSILETEDSKNETKLLQRETQELKTIIMANREKQIARKKQNSP